MTFNPDDMNNPEGREAAFARNTDLELLLRSLNQDLKVAETQVLDRFRDHKPKHPFVFLVGAPRSGSTLFMQWLASTGAFSYPSNLLSRFWEAPIIGAKIQRMLTDRKFAFRQEFEDFNADINFDSVNGKTKGTLSPNEFWYFWRRFISDNDHEAELPLDTQEGKATLRAELAGLVDVFEKPMAMKGLIFNHLIPEIAALLPNATFIWLRRSPEYTIQSLLETRKRQFGDYTRWYSFATDNFETLRTKEPLESVAGQLADIHHTVSNGLARIPNKQKTIIEYENFCHSPAKTYQQLKALLASQRHQLPDYNGTKAFDPKNHWRLDWTTPEKARASYRKLQL